jgi:hypothetical protein
MSSKVTKQADGRFRAEATNLPGMRPQFGRTSVEAMGRLAQELQKQWKTGAARPRGTLRQW